MYLRLLHIQRGIFFVEKLLQQVLHVRACCHCIDTLCHQLGCGDYLVCSEFEEFLVILVALGIGDDEKLPAAFDLLLIESCRSDHGDVVRDIVRQCDHPFGRREVRLEDTLFGMGLGGDKIGVAVFFGDLLEIFTWIDDDKRDMVFPKLLGDLNGKLIVIADHKVVFQSGDLVKHFALLGDFLEFSLFDNLHDDPHGDRKDDKPEDDQCNGKDASQIRDGTYLAKSHSRKCNTGLVYGIHQGKAVYGHIAKCTDQHDQNSKYERESERG